MPRKPHRPLADVLPTDEALAQMRKAGGTWAAYIVRCESVATKRELGLSLSHWMLKHPSFPNGCPARRYQ